MQRNLNSIMQQTKVTTSEDPEGTDDTVTGMIHGKDNDEKQENDTNLMPPPTKRMHLNEKNDDVIEINNSPQYAVYKFENEPSTSSSSSSLAPIADQSDEEHYIMESSKQLPMVIIKSEKTSKQYNCDTASNPTNDQFTASSKSGVTVSMKSNILDYIDLTEDNESVPVTISTGDEISDIVEGSEGSNNTNTNIEEHLPTQSSNKLNIHQSMRMPTSETETSLEPLELVVSSLIISNFINQLHTGIKSETKQEQMECAYLAKGNNSAEYSNIPDQINDNGPEKQSIATNVPSMNIPLPTSLTPNQLPSIETGPSTSRSAFASTSIDIANAQEANFTNQFTINSVITALQRNNRLIMPTNDALNLNASCKLSPPRPNLLVSENIDNSIVLLLSMEAVSDDYEKLNYYEVFTFVKTGDPSSPNGSWYHVGDIKAKPLPMAIKIENLEDGQRYYFAVRAVDSCLRCGPFSSAETWKNN